MKARLPLLQKVQRLAASVIPGTLTWGDKEGSGLWLQLGLRVTTEAFLLPGKVFKMAAT